jgi:hypothetical protein
VEDELVNHVKVHQIFNILKEDFRDEETIGVDRDPVLGNLHPVLGNLHPVLGNLYPVLGNLHHIL